MRLTSLIACGLVVIALIAGVGWAMRTTTPPQDSPPALDGTLPADDPAVAPEEKAEIPEQPKDAGMEKANPFSLSEEGPQPKAVIEELKHEFGRLALGATGHHDFVIRNEGTAPLTLAKGESTCQCTQFDISAKELAPGETATVKISWKPKYVAKTFEQSANVWTNDPKQPRIVLTVSGAVVTLITKVPEGIWTIGTLTEGQSTTSSGVIASSLAESFEILSAASTSPNVEVAYEPLDAEALKRLDALSGYSVKCTVSPNMPVGVFHESISLNLSLPEASTVQFDLQGSRIGPYQIIGPGWTQERHTLAMGRCASGKGKTTKVSLFVAVPDGADLTFEEPIVTPPVLKVSLQKDEKFSGGGRQRFFINLEAPAGITPGRWSGDTAINVELNCNHPTVAKAIFKVELQAD